MPYDGPATAVALKCPKCPSESIKRQVWESSDGAYEDYHFTCPDCGFNWWVDGPDA